MSEIPITDITDNIFIRISIGTDSSKFPIPNGIDTEDIPFSKFSYSTTEELGKRIHLWIHHGLGLNALKELIQRAIDDKSEHTIPYSAKVRVWAVWKLDNITFRSSLPILEYEVSVDNKLYTKEGIYRTDIYWQMPITLTEILYNMKGSYVQQDEKAPE